MVEIPTKIEEEDLLLKDQHFEDPDYEFLKSFSILLQRFKIFTVDLFSVLKYGSSKDSFILFFWMYFLKLNLLFEIEPENYENFL